MIDWKAFNIDLGRGEGRTTGYVKTYCPHCHDNGKPISDHSLSCNVETGAYKCHRCGWQGFATITTDEEKEAWMRQQPWYHDYTKKKSEPKKDYAKPPKPKSNSIHPDVISYFQHRGISESTLKLMHVTSGTDWMPANEKKNRRLPDGGNCTTIHFNYIKDGEVVATKLRSGDKMFRQAKAGCEQVPYNMDAIKNSSDVYIVEGEIDALSLAEIGYTQVVSVPDGGSDKSMHWLSDYYESHFANKKTIYICVDNDTVGSGLSDELAKHFDPADCVFVTDFGINPTTNTPNKDANECLVSLGPDTLRKKLSEGRTVRPEGDADMESLGNDLDDLYTNGLPKGTKIGFTNLDEYMSLEKGRLVIVTGTPGSGKSQFLDQVAEKMAVGHGWRFSMFSPEMMPLSLHMAMLVSKFTGLPFNRDELNPIRYQRAKRMVIDHFHFIDPDSYDIDQILSIAKYQVRKYGCDALIIDPWNDLTMNGEGITKTDDINSALLKILTFAQRQNIVVFVMAHPSKIGRTKDGQTPEPTLSDISGSIHFFNRADIGIVVVRVNENGREYTKIKISKMRFANLGKVGEVYFKYGLGVGRFHPYDVVTDTTDWDNSDHLDVQTIQSSIPTDTPATTKRNHEGNVSAFLLQAQRQDRLIEQQKQTKQHDNTALHDENDIFKNNENEDTPF